MNRLVVIVVNWNKYEDTISCVNSLVSQDSQNFDIVIIDNGSTSDSVRKLDLYASSHSRTTLIKNSKNLGFSGGVNTGLRWAIKKDYDFAALLNNDAVTEKSWLKNLVRAMNSDNSIGITTGLLLDKSGDFIDSTGEQYSNWGLPFPRDRDKEVSEATKSGYTFGATGGASLYRIKMLKAIGLFDEDFFAYYEDVDISFRAQLAGWKVYYTNKAIAFHSHGTTSKLLPGFTVKQTFKNLPLLFIKNVPLRYIFPVGIRFYFAYSLMLGKAIVGKSRMSAIQGAAQSLVLQPKKIKERRAIQKNNSSRKEIYSLFVAGLPPGQTGLRKLLRKR